MLTPARLTITVLILLGVLGVASGAVLNSPTEGMEQMNLDRDKVLQVVEIPRMDASTPIMTETATFSLG